MAILVLTLNKLLHSQMFRSELSQEEVFGLELCHEETFRSEVYHKEVLTSEFSQGEILGSELSQEENLTTNISPQQSTIAELSRKNIFTQEMNIFEEENCMAEASTFQRERCQSDWCMSHLGMYTVMFEISCRNCQEVGRCQKELIYLNEKFVNS